VEFNTPAVSTEQDFVNVHNQALQMIKNDLPPYVYLDIVGSKHFLPDYLKSKLANTFGCMPDIDIWTDTPNKPPKAKNNTLRTAAGHLHISYENHNIADSLFLAKLFDYFLGVPSLFLDNDTERRKMYGKAGAVRLKPRYGFEYRVLSNFWLSSDENMRFIFKQIKNVFDFANHNPDFDFEDSDVVREAINEYNLEKAAYIIKKYDHYFHKPHELLNAKKIEWEVSN
jgi:hypothetical protein